jgi:lipid-A-disaccharide synthase
MPLRVALVAGEASGDQLAAGLMRAIRERHPDVKFEGVAGPKMIAEGCHKLGSIDELSLMGLTEVLAHLPRLLRLRRELTHCFLDDRPDVFIGIDAPDFNLGLERRLRKAGIPTVHYVSPTVWAWRRGRIATVERAADLVLCLFPFEPELYAGRRCEALFAGHPLAREIASAEDRLALRREFGLPDTGPVVTLMPGSRESEVRRLGPAFLQAARLLLQRYPDIRFLAPMSGAHTESVFAGLGEWNGVGLPVQIVKRDARKAIAAADVVLAASGTATMECMLLERPAVVAYKVSAMTYALLRGLRLARLEHYAMPNILAGETLMPELMQDRVRGPTMADEVAALLDAPERREALAMKFRALAESLRASGPRAAADAVIELATSR